MGIIEPVRTPFEGQQTDPIAGTIKAKSRKTPNFLPKRAAARYQEISKTSYQNSRTSGSTTMSSSASGPSGSSPSDNPPPSSPIPIQKGGLGGCICCQPGGANVPHSIRVLTLYQAPGNLLCSDCGGKSSDGVSAYHSAVTMACVG